jgi:hypothetical protein
MIQLCMFMALLIIVQQKVPSTVGKSRQLDEYPTITHWIVLIASGRGVSRRDTIAALHKPQRKCHTNLPSRLLATYLTRRGSK